jgi:hypothetical protein
MRLGGTCRHALINCPDFNLFVCVEKLPHLAFTIGLDYFC